MILLSVIGCLACEFFIKKGTNGAVAGHGLGVLFATLFFLIAPRLEED